MRKTNLTASHPNPKLAPSSQKGEAGLTYRLIAASILVVLAVAALLIARWGDGGDDGTPTQDGASPINGDNGEDLFELELRAQNTQFDKGRLQAPAGSEVSLTLDNRDSVEHNFSLYESEASDRPLFEGPLLPGPAFLIYQFTAPEGPGTYHFHCDVHPDTMKGDFIVE